VYLRSLFFILTILQRWVYLLENQRLIILLIDGFSGHWMKGRDTGRYNRCVKRKDLFSTKWKVSRRCKLIARLKYQQIRQAFLQTLLLVLHQ
jgi:hypothetical protein